MGTYITFTEQGTVFQLAGNVLAIIHFTCFMLLTVSDQIEAQNINNHSSAIFSCLTIPLYLYIIQDIQEKLLKISTL